MGLTFVLGQHTLSSLINMLGCGWSLIDWDMNRGWIKLDVVLLTSQ
jgi:hypothetical protein